MIEIFDFDPADLSALAVQPDQQGDVGLLDGGAQILAMARGGPAFTACRGGRPIACAGLYENHPRWATAWAVLSPMAPAELLAITRRCRAAIAASGYARIDCLVRRGFDAAREWAWLLGFAQETTLSQIWPDGGDALLFARFKGND